MGTLKIDKNNPRIGKGVKPSDLALATAAQTHADIRANKEILKSHEIYRQVLSRTSTKMVTSDQINKLIAAKRADLTGRESTDKLLLMASNFTPISDRRRAAIFEASARALAGINQLGHLHSHEEVSEVTGGISYKRLLVEDAYDMMNRTVLLPVGDLSNFTDEQARKIRTMAAMVAERVGKIADIDVDEAVEAAFSIMTEKGLGGPDYEPLQGESQEAFASRIQAMAAEMKAVWVDRMHNGVADAQRRFVSMNIIQPLLRDVLIRKSDISTISGFNVTEMAKMYAHWLFLLNNNMPRPRIANNIMADVTKVPRAASLAALREIVAQGIPTNFVFALDTISKAINDGEYDTTSYNFSEDDENGSSSKFSVEMRLGNTYIKRNTVLSSVVNHPLVIEDNVFNSAYESLTGSEVRDLMTGAIHLLAMMKSVRVADEISLDFITKYPEWSGFLTSADMDSDAARNVDKFLSFVNDLIYAQFLTYVLSPRQLSSPLSSVLIEASNAEILDTYNDILSVVVSAYQSVVDVASRFLTSIRRSREFRHLTIWAELETMNLLSPLQDTRSAWTSMRYSLMTAALPIITDQKLQAERTSVDLHTSYLDSRFVPANPLYSSFLQRLKDSGVVGDLYSIDYDVRHFVTSTIPYVTLDDAIRAADRYPWLFKKSVAALKIMSLSEVIDMVGRNTNGLKLDVLDDVDQLDWLDVHAQVAMVPMVPTIYRTFSSSDQNSSDFRIFDVRYLDIQSVPELEAGEDSYIAVISELPDNIALKYSQHMLADPKMFIKSRTVSSVDVPISPLFLLNGKVDDFYFQMIPWAHNTQQDPETNE